MKALFNILILIFLLSQASYVLAQDEVAKVLPMRAINSMENESNPCYFTYKGKNGILFTSDRKSSAFTAQVNLEGEYINDLYFAELIDGKLKNAKNVDELNTKRYEFSSCVSFDGKTVFITKNIKAVKNISAPDRFGIFYTTIDNDGYWSVPTEFEHNSKEDNGYKILDPAISPDGTILVYSGDLDKPDNYDLYMSKLDIYGNWSKPKSLGSEFNTKRTERFPSFDKEGNLYFSSNGHSDDMGMDILRAKLKNDGTWDKPELLPEPINSKFHDFGLATMDGEHGFFNSTRNRKGDDIFSFYLPKDKTPEFTNCQPNKKRHLCYYIYDDNINMDDGTPYRFDWYFDDGSTLSGQRVKKCFPEPGSYVFTLNITDTLENEVFKKVSNGIIEVEDIQTPFIVSKDEFKPHQTVKLSAEQQELVPFKITEYYWFVEGKKVELGENVSFVFDKPGTYSITLGVIGNPERPDEKRCVHKEIVVR